MKLFILMVLLFLNACTDAEKLSYTTLGSKFDVDCYSGGKLIFSGKTTGQHATSAGGTFVFLDNATNKGIEINANCIFIQEK